MKNAFVRLTNRQSTVDRKSSEPEESSTEIPKLKYKQKKKRKKKTNRTEHPRTVG